MTIRLAIFDLDDTLSDHLHSCACGIEALRERFPVLASRPTLPNSGSELSGCEKEGQQPRFGRMCAAASAFRSPPAA
jgi:FMN phosphatase YigB (HAD superfamily)